MAVLSVCCAVCDDCYPAKRPIPTGMVRLDSGKLVCERCAGRLAQGVGDAVGFQAAAALTMKWLKKPAQLMSSVGNATMPPVSRGDWAGLGRAVDAGILSNAEAITLAASWQVGAVLS